MAYKLVSWLQTVEYLLLPQIVIGDFKVMVTGSVFEFPSLIDSYKESSNQKHYHIKAIVYFCL